MKILNVNAALARREGGTSERVYQLTRHLILAGEEATLLIVNVSWSREASVDPLVEPNLIRLPSLNDRFFVPRSGFGLIRRLVRDCDVIHMMSHWAAINALVYVAARLFRKPYVLCPAGALRIYGRSRALKRLYHVLVGRSMVRNADAIIAVVKEEIPDIVAAGGDARRIVVIPNAIVPEDYSARDDSGFRSRHDLGDAPFLMFLGRLNSIKGPDLLIEAFCNAIDALGEHHLVFAGLDEGQWSVVRDVATRRGVGDRVHYVGLIGAEEKSMALNAAEFLAIPSRAEAMSIVVLEAAAAGIPVLITDQCGFNDVEVIGGGVVVPATIEGLEAGLRAMMRRRDRFGAMGQRLRQYAIEGYSWSAMVERYRTLFSDIVARRAKRAAG